MAEETERDILQQLVPGLEAEGYEVFLHPNRPLLPEFFAGYVPNAIARRGNRNLAIEVSRRSPVAERKMDGLAKLFEARKDWELRVVWIAPTTSEKSLQVQAPGDILQRVSEIRELADSGHFSPALLLAWATFEAVGRMLAFEQFQRPQTPGRLVQVLASEGYLTPTEADTLRALADKRNRLIHGELQIGVSKEEIDRFGDVLATMLKLVGK
jgi:uncharacterized protein YutE (UPF0331/DUF86 family)